MSKFALVLIVVVCATQISAVAQENMSQINRLPRSLTIIASINYDKLDKKDLQKELKDLQKQILVAERTANQAQENANQAANSTTSVTLIALQHGQKRTHNQQIHHTQEGRFASSPLVW